MRANQRHCAGRGRFVADLAASLTHAAAHLLLAHSAQIPGSSLISGTLHKFVLSQMDKLTSLFPTQAEQSAHPAFWIEVSHSRLPASFLLRPAGLCRRCSLDATASRSFVVSQLEAWIQQNVPALEKGDVEALEKMSAREKIEKAKSCLSPKGPLGKILNAVRRFIGGVCGCQPARGGA